MINSQTPHSIDTLSFKPSYLDQLYKNVIKSWDIFNIMTFNTLTVIKCVLLNERR